jgi:hypothetical protein
MESRRIRALPGELAVCRLPEDAEIPAWAWQGPICGALRGIGEVSVVTAVDAVPDGVRSEGPWRALMVEGPLDFALTGVLSTIAQTLAVAQISLFALSTFDTDYILVKSEDLSEAVIALELAGHMVEK